MDSKSWWQIDKTSSNKSLQQLCHEGGATPLLYVCRDVYGWKSEKANRILTGYRQFLELKKKLGDFDGKILEASNIIDQMWVQHYSCNTYTDDCQLLCGGFVKRNGYNRLNFDARAKRIDTTKLMLEKAKFEENSAVDTEIWAFEHSPSPHNDTIVPASKEKEEEEAMTILFRPHLSLSLREAHYDMPLHESFVVAACVYAEDQGTEYRNLRFIVDEQVVVADRSLKELGFADTQVVDVLPIHEGEGLGSTSTKS